VSTYLDSTYIHITNKCVKLFMFFHFIIIQIILFLSLTKIHIFILLFVPFLYVSTYKYFTRVRSPVHYIHLHSYLRIIIKRIGDEMRIFFLNYECRIYALTSHITAWNVWINSGHFLTRQLDILYKKKSCIYCSNNY